jgi:hypothetical protein
VDASVGGKVGENSQPSMFATFSAVNAIAIVIRKQVWQSVNRPWSSSGC